MENLEVSFGGKTREGDSVTVIKNAPISAYELVRAEIERLQRLMEGFTVACMPAQYDQVDITLTLKKGSPEKYTDVVWVIVDAVVKKTERILAEYLIQKEEPKEEPQARPIGTKENSREALRAPLQTEPLVCVSIPRMLHNEDTQEEKLKKMKFQMVVFDIIERLKKYLAGERIHTKVSQSPGEKRGTSKLFIDIDADQIPRAKEFLKKFETECGKNIHAKYYFVFEPIAGEEKQFELKLKKKSTPPNSTSS